MSEVLYRLTDLFVQRGPPDHLRSDNGSEFTAKVVRNWLERVGVGTLYIEPGSPWENGYLESFNGKLKNELLDRELFDTLREAKALRRPGTVQLLRPQAVCPGRFRAGGGRLQVERG